MYIQSSPVILIISGDIVNRMPKVTNAIAAKVLTMLLLDDPLVFGTLVVAYVLHFNFHTLSL